MTQWISLKLFDKTILEDILSAAIIVAVGFTAIYILRFIVRKTIGRRLTIQWNMIVQKGILYLGITIIVLVMLRFFGVELGALLGAAGVVGIVVGIASQTSIGNIVSGLFLVSEKTFEIGDIISIGNKTGVVTSIDLLSIKIRTFDNLYIRIPNQKMISEDLTNITRFPLRRSDLNLKVEFGENLERVKVLLKKIAAENLLVLREPEPLILFRDFGHVGVDILFGVWTLQENFLEVKNGVLEAVLKEFEQAGIPVPSLQAANFTPPMP